MSFDPGTEPFRSSTSGTTSASATAGSPLGRAAGRAPAAPERVVDVSACVEPGTRLALLGANVLAVLGCAVLVVTIYGALIAVAGAIANVFLRRRARALLAASALRIGPRQFPEIHASATGFARRLGLAETPEVFVVDASEVNGFAMRFGRESVIVLTDETVGAAMEGKSAGALQFVIAHELAHVALGHHRLWRGMLRRLRKLSRLDEHSADRVACELVGSEAAAEDGILLLCAGPRLLSFVDRGAAREQARAAVANPLTAKAERVLTHPTTLRRLARVGEHFARAA
jgi:Zn-dependent protease with chaperone function